MRISDWSSDVCSSDLISALTSRRLAKHYLLPRPCPSDGPLAASRNMSVNSGPITAIRTRSDNDGKTDRSEEHTSELQSLMRISYAVFCLKKKKKRNKKRRTTDRYKPINTQNKI